MSTHCQPQQPENMSLDFMTIASVKARTLEKRRTLTRQGREILWSLRTNGVSDLPNMDPHSVEIYADFCKKWVRDFQRDPESMPVYAPTLGEALALPDFSDGVVCSVSKDYSKDPKRMNFYENDVLDSFQRLFSSTHSPVVKLPSTGDEALYVSPSQGVTRGVRPNTVSRSLDLGTVIAINPTQSLRVLISHKFIGQSGGGQNHQFEELHRTHEACSSFWKKKPTRYHKANEDTLLFLVCDGEQGSRHLRQQSKEHPELTGRVFWCSSMDLPILLAAEICNRYPTTVSPRLSQTLDVWARGETPFVEQGGGLPCATQKSEMVNTVCWF